MNIGDRWRYGIVVVMLLGVSGCEPALFPDRQQRTPFERYQLLHGEYRKQSRTTKYGADEPDLRERLRPLDRTY